MNVNLYHASENVYLYNNEEYEVFYADAFDKSVVVIGSIMNETYKENVMKSNRVHTYTATSDNVTLANAFYNAIINAEKLDLHDEIKNIRDILIREFVDIQELQGNNVKHEFKTLMGSYYYSENNRFVFNTAIKMLYASEFYVDFRKYIEKPLEGFESRQRDRKYIAYEQRLIRTANFEKIITFCTNILNNAIKTKLHELNIELNQAEFMLETVNLRKKVEELTKKNEELRIKLEKLTNSFSFTFALKEYVYSRTQKARQRINTLRNVFSNVIDKQRERYNEVCNSLKRSFDSFIDKVKKQRDILRDKLNKFKGGRTL